MSSPNMHVLVVGASIAGPCAAYWFSKLGSHVKVTVIERFPALRTGGQNIDIRTVGVTVMRKIPGMEAEVRARKYDIKSLTMVDPKGAKVATMTSSGNAEQQNLLSEFEILRGDLSEILVEYTKGHERVEYVFGEQVSSLSESGDKMRVEFLNGYPTTEYDLVVAADGSTSRTRGMGLECGVRDHVIPMNSWAAFFTVKEDLMEGRIEGRAWTAPGGRFLAIEPDLKAPGTHAGWMKIQPRSAPDITEEFRSAMKKGYHAVKELVAKEVDGEGWKTQEIAAAMMKADDFYATELVQVKVPKLYNKRFALVGDAAHASAFTGTGTSLALAGPYILAGEIGRCQGDIMAGLKAYEERMRPIIDDLQKIPPGMPGLMAPQTAWGLWLRNNALYLMMLASTFGSIFGPIFSWAGNLFGAATGTDKYNLPKYEWAG